MLTKEQKNNYISEMTTQFENSKAVMVTHYQGLTMTQLDELRAQMREHGIIFNKEEYFDVWLGGSRIKLGEMKIEIIVE